MSSLQQPYRPPQEVLPDPATADNVIYNPSQAELREFSDLLERTTEYDSPSYVSKARSRSSDKTADAVEKDFDEEDYAYAEVAYEAARTREMVCLDRQVGRHPEHSYVCRLYLPKLYSRIALAWSKLFGPVDEDRVEAGYEPDFVTIQVPEYGDVGIRIFPEEGFTAVLGSDYTGEAKKSILRLFMYREKQRGGLGLHAGTKHVELEGEDGMMSINQVFLGLSATGKSTLTAHDLNLEKPEYAEMIQDDVCALTEDGALVGSEDQGLYIKTIGLTREEQGSLYDAAIHESAVLENVDVATDGTVDFHSDRHTKNSRAVVQRDHLDSAADEIDLPDVDQVFFITRNPVMPPISKLTPEESAAAFMLGESVESSAGDPTRAGESIRVVGTNPFIIGSKGKEGNRFRDLIADLDVECFVLNTGEVGGRDIALADTVAILRAVSRGTIEWTTDEATGLSVPESVPGVDLSRLTVADAVPNHVEQLKNLRSERRTYLAEFDDLDDEIVSAVY